MDVLNKSKYLIQKGNLCAKIFNLYKDIYISHLEVIIFLPTEGGLTFLEFKIPSGNNPNSLF